MATALAGSPTSGSENGQPTISEKCGQLVVLRRACQVDQPQTATSTTKHDYRDVCLVVEPPTYADDVAQQGVRQRVQSLWPIQRDVRDTPASVLGSEERVPNRDLQVGEVGRWCRHGAIVTTCRQVTEAGVCRALMHQSRTQLRKA